MTDRIKFGNKLIFWGALNTLINFGAITIYTFGTYPSVVAAAIHGVISIATMTGIWVGLKYRKKPTSWSPDSLILEDTGYIEDNLFRSSQEPNRNLLFKFVMVGSEGQITNTYIATDMKVVWDVQAWYEIPFSMKVYYRVRGRYYPSRKLKRMIIAALNKSVENE